MLPRIVSMCVIASTLFLAAPASAEGIAVEVSASSQKQLAPDELVTVQQVLVREVDKLAPPKGTLWIVSAQVTRLDTIEDKKSSTTTCVISLAVRDKKTGALRGLTSGTSVVTSKPNDKTARVLGIEGAVQGATRGLPKLMK